MSKLLYLILATLITLNILYDTLIQHTGAKRIQKKLKYFSR